MQVAIIIYYLIFQCVFLSRQLVSDGHLCFFETSRCSTPQGGTRVQHCGALRHARNRLWIYECLDGNGAPGHMKWRWCDGTTEAHARGYWWLHLLTIVNDNDIWHIYDIFPSDPIVVNSPILVNPIHRLWCLNLPNLLVETSWNMLEPQPPAVEPTLTNRSICLSYTTTNIFGSGSKWPSPLEMHMALPP